MNRYNRYQHKRQWDKRFVDPLKGKDHECLLLGSMGYYSRFIARKTGLTEGQVNYRLSKYGISRSEIRNGEGVFAKVMISTVRERMEVSLARHIRSELNGG